MGKPAIVVENMSMMFNLNKEKVDNLKEYFIKLVTRKLHFTEFWALRDISFTVEKGDRVGVLGFNGAGKSTLLKVIAGVLKPTEGKVRVNGIIAPMLELGAGFDMNYSGKENVFLYGATMGYPRKFIESKYDQIVEFSELGDFIEVPVKNYSSGMRARLGFAIATAVEPEILILDEATSALDNATEILIQQALDELCVGRTTLVVAHRLSTVKNADEIAVIANGRITEQGTHAELMARRGGTYAELYNLQFRVL